MNLPDFLCIGAQKAGTTWLHKMLQGHRDVFLGPFKEYQFFNSLFVPRHRRWTGWHVKMSLEKSIRNHLDQKGPTHFQFLKRLVTLGEDEFMFSEDWYRLIYTTPGAIGKIKGDITPEYCTIPEHGIEYVQKLLGPVPVVYIIRDPLSRALSQLRMNINRKKTDQKPTKDEWLQLVDDWDIANRGDYQTNITRWLAKYPNDKLLFIPYRDISTDPISVLRRVEAHIGLPAGEYPDAGERIHEGAKIVVPDNATAKMRELVEPQYAFLNKQFGSDFCSRL